MNPDRPLFVSNAEEQALFQFYDPVSAAELWARADSVEDLSVSDFDEPAVTWAQAVALLEDCLGATLIDD